jgi:hypothetical protein
MVGQGCEAGRPKAVSVRTRRGVARTQAVSAITLALVKHIQIGLLSVCLSVCLSVWLAGWLALLSLTQSRAWQGLGSC